MQQFVNNATRGENILDVVLCNNPLFVTDTQIGFRPQGLSDHCSTTCCFNIKNCNDRDNMSVCADDLIHRRNSCLRNLIWSKCNWALIENYLREVDWKVIFSCSANSEELYSLFLYVICFIAIYF